MLPCSQKAKDTATGREAGKDKTMRETTYIMRNGELEHIWQFKVTINGFDNYVYIRGTETEARDYMHEHPMYPNGSHHALSEKEQEMIGALGITVYIAPRH